MTPGSAEFQKLVWSYYQNHRRDLPWRRTLDPYLIVVSEFMLQQTQVGRVVPKFAAFIGRFPNLDALARSPRSEVVAAWQGLGYNRRAIALHETAKKIRDTYKGNVPRDPDLLEALPGIGWATARSIAAFAFNVPVIFIETNIRRVFIHHFFAAEATVSDREILPLIARTLPPSRAREWYWALMDYGTHLASTVPNPNRRSRHYTRQSSFEGSMRQLRGALLRHLAVRPLTAEQCVEATGRSAGEVATALEGLGREGFLECRRGRWRLKS